MAATPSRKRLTLTTALAAAAVSLSACTAVVDGAAVAGDRGPCAHVDAPMLDVPVSSSSEPSMRIPEPLGWQRDLDFEDYDPNVRLALSNTDEAAGDGVAVMIKEVPDANPAAMFDNFEMGLVQGLEQEDLPTDVTRTANTLCGLPSEMMTFAVTDAATGVSATTLVVVAESGGDTYLISVLQTVDPAHQAQLREAETILTGFEVLPQDGTVA
jgi:hypothetical protein